MNKRYDIKGMGCAACSARIEKCVGAMEGVRKVEVNLLANNMVVNFDESLCTSQDIMDTVSDACYEAFEEAEEEVHRRDPSEITKEHAGEMKRRFIVSLIFAVPLFVISMGSFIDKPAIYIVQALLVAPIIAINYKYFTVGFSCLEFSRLNRLGTCKLRCRAYEPSTKSTLLYNSSITILLQHILYQYSNLNKSYKFSFVQYHY